MVSITKENLIEPLEFEIAQGPGHCDVIDAVDGKPCEPCSSPIAHDPVPAYSPPDCRARNSVPSFGRESSCGMPVGQNGVLTTDNAKNLNNKLIDELCAQLRIQHRNSSPYYTIANNSKSRLPSEGGGRPRLEESHGALDHIPKRMTEPSLGSTSGLGRSPAPISIVSCMSHRP
ncbi:hypothetical protein CRG98_000740 [Punica granatum]|uniref:Uncharacterized protein n=1 Tax=Punica granatum TaxID=22663 RepID=A0A2I0LDY5_PUNGR|nr:hypothetical protein CRG98_000740 [Punica granatum]